jgi:kinesin family protein 1
MSFVSLLPSLAKPTDIVFCAEPDGLFPVIYSIQPGTTVVGNVETVGASIQIRLSGSRIGMRHAVFVNQGGTVTVEALPDGSEGGAGSMSILNGKRLEPGKVSYLSSALESDDSRECSSTTRSVLPDLVLFALFTLSLQPQTLRSGYRLILGDYHVFRFNHPEEVRQHREKVRLAASVSAPEMQRELIHLTSNRSDPEPGT